MEKFRFNGPATIQHINARKEGPNDDKVLAVDLKLEAEVDKSVLDMVGEGLLDFLFLEGGAVRNVMLEPLKFSYQIEDYRMSCLGSTHFGVRVKNITIAPKDSYRVVLGFSVSFKPSGNEVARMAEYLQDSLDVVVEAPTNDLNLEEKE